MLRAIYSFDHCPRTQSPVQGGVLVSPQVGIGQGILLPQPANVAVDQNGFIGGYRAAESFVTIDLTGVLPPNQTKVTVGFRMLTLMVYASLHSLIHFAPASAGADTAGYLFGMGPTAPWSQTLNAESYVEVTYDFAAGSASVLVNGVPAVFGQGPALSAATKAAFAAGTGAINFRLASSATFRYAIRDIYVVDDVAGDGMVGPIGPQKMFPIILDAADGAGWTASGAATPLDVLNTALPGNPYTSSPADKTPLVTSLKTTAPLGSRVNAVSLSLSGTSVGDGPSTSKIELSQGGQTLTPKFVVVQRAITYAAPIGIFPKAPDGATWDLAKIDATTLKLTPDTVA